MLHACYKVRDLVPDARLDGSENPATLSSFSIPGKASIFYSRCCSPQGNSLCQFRRWVGHYIKCRSSVSPSSLFLSRAGRQSQQAQGQCRFSGVVPGRRALSTVGFKGDHVTAPEVKSRGRSVVTLMRDL